MLSENIKDKEYSFNIGDRKNTLKYAITYIGNLTSKNEINRVLHETILSGNIDSPYLIIYDNKDSIPKKFL